MIMTYFAFFLVFLFPPLSSSSLPDADLNRKCRRFVEEGYCEVNPSYMKKNCAASFFLWEQQMNSQTDFYSITEDDIFGQQLSFEMFRGKILYIINVASEDGITLENYKMLNEIATLRSSVFEVLIFPCNQFGNKEPRSERDIFRFAQSHGFKGIIMSKGDVNGVDARPSFQYLKAHSPKKQILGNFDGKYIVGIDGTVITLEPSDDPYQVISSMLSLVKAESL